MNSARILVQSLRSRCFRFRTVTRISRPPSKMRWLVKKCEGAQWQCHCHDSSGVTGSWGRWIHGVRSVFMRSSKDVDRLNRVQEAPRTRRQAVRRRCGRPRDHTRTHVVPSQPVCAVCVKKMKNLFVRLASLYRTAGVLDVALARPDYACAARPAAAPSRRRVIVIRNLSSGLTAPCED